MAGHGGPEGADDVDVRAEGLPQRKRAARARVSRNAGAAANVSAAGT